MIGTKIAKTKTPLDKYHRWVCSSQGLFIALWLGMSCWLLIDAALHPGIYYIAVNLTIFFLWNLFFLPSVVASLMSLYLIKEQEKGEFLKVDRAYSRLLKNFPLIFKANRRVAATNYCNLGTARLYQGNLESAEKAYETAVETASKDKQFRRTAYMGMIYNNLAVCLMHQGRLSEAEVIAQNAVDLSKEKTARKWGAVQGLPHTTLGGILLLQNRLDEANEQLDEAQIYYDQDPGWGNMKVSQVIYRSLLAARRGKTEESLSFFKELIELKEANPTWITTLSVMPLYLLANEYMNSRQFKAAEQALHAAYAVGKQHPVHPVSIKLRSFCEKYLLLTNRQNEVKDMHSWLWEPAEVMTSLTQEGRKQ